MVGISARDPYPTTSPPLLSNNIFTNVPLSFHFSLDQQYPLFNGLIQRKLTNSMCSAHYNELILAQLAESLNKQWKATLPNCLYVTANLDI